MTALLYPCIRISVIVHDVGWCVLRPRHILASLHFNENLLREPQKTKDGKDYLLVTYPKYKFGEEVVREIRVSPTYSKYNDMQ